MNPRDLAMQMMKNSMGGNPMIQNLFNLANKGEFNNIEQIARNLCQTKGINADDAFNQMISQFNVNKPN